MSLNWTPLTGCYNPDTHKIVPKDAVVLDLHAANPGGDMEIKVENIVKALRKGTTSSCLAIADQIEAQTKPPRIPEPGLYGVVSSENRGLTTYFWHSHGGWHGEDGSILEWEDIANPKLIREGV